MLGYAVALILVATNPPVTSVKDAGCEEALRIIESAAKRAANRLMTPDMGSTLRSPKSDRRASMVEDFMRDIRRYNITPELRNPEILQKLKDARNVLAAEVAVTQLPAWVLQSLIRKAHRDLRVVDILLKKPNPNSESGAKKKNKDEVRAEQERRLAELTANFKRYVELAAAFNTLDRSHTRFLYRKKQVQGAFFSLNLSNGFISRFLIDRIVHAASKKSDIKLSNDVTYVDGVAHPNVWDAEDVRIFVLVNEKVFNDYQAAFHQAVVQNVPLAVSRAAKAYPGEGEIDLEFIDYVTAGVRGVMRAVADFDLDLEYKFSTLCMVWIKNQIQELSTVSGRLIRIPRIRQISKGQDLSDLPKRPRSLSLPVGENGRNSLGDFIASTRSEGNSHILDDSSKEGRRTQYRNRIVEFFQMKARDWMQRDDVDPDARVASPMALRIIARRFPETFDQPMSRAGLRDIGSYLGIGMAEKGRKISTWVEEQAKILIYLDQTPRLAKQDRDLLKLLIGIERSYPLDFSDFEGTVSQYNKYHRDLLEAPTTKAASAEDLLKLYRSIVKPNSNRGIKEE